MSVLESILLFTVSALLLTVAAIHGFVLVMIRLDKRRDESERDAGGENRIAGFIEKGLNGSGKSIPGSARKQ